MNYYYTDNSVAKTINDTITEKLNLLSLELNDPNINNLCEIGFDGKTQALFIKDECESSLKSKIIAIVDEVVSYYRANEK